MSLIGFEPGVPQHTSHTFHQMHTAIVYRMFYRLNNRRPPYSDLGRSNSTPSSLHIHIAK